MGKRTNKSKRSLASLPKGLPTGKRKSGDSNPFESTSRTKRPKYDVVNRNLPKPGDKQSSLERSLERRQTQLRGSLKNSKKTNAFVDRRIGEFTMNPEDQMLARIVKERSQRSRKISKYSLDDDGAMLTHKGKSIDGMAQDDHIILSDDDDDGGNLEAIDTELHFGGGSFNKSANANPYGSGGGSNNMADVYSNRKTELDDMIARRKLMKAERFKHKESQAEAFENMDDSFKELSSLLQFRDKEEERKERFEAKKAGTLTQDEIEMNEWDKEMKTYLFERRVKATDRTKTPEEIANAEAKKLQELETKRLARMSGDFENDDLSDISDGEENVKRKKRKPKKMKKVGNADELDDSDDEDEKKDDLQARFTADGLVYVDKQGNVVKKAGEESESDDETQQESGESDSEESDSDDDDDDDDASTAVNLVLTVGARVKANYHADAQYEGKETWHDAVISAVNRNPDGTIKYDVTYDDGDFEEDMEPEHIKPVKKTKEEKTKEKETQESDGITKLKRQKAKVKARKEIPFVFEVPTTLEVLHDIIGRYASTGSDASLIIDRIHKANSIRLDKRNTEKMQNFYDVILRRFIAVGDAIHTSGNGGSELGRYEQLNALTRILYRMSQDSPECAGAVWSRRLGIFQNALAKRLRDAEFVSPEGDSESTWPSTGTFLLLRAAGHIFPVTDQRHHVVTPTLLLLGQIISQTPVRSSHDLVMGILCSGLMIEYTKEANRIAPEALSFLAGAVRLFAAPGNEGGSVAPSLEAATKLSTFESIRSEVANCKGDGADLQISLEQGRTDSPTMPASILCSALGLVKSTVQALGGSLKSAESESFAEITDSLLCLKPSSKRSTLPTFVASQITDTAAAVSGACQLNVPRAPLVRRTGPTTGERAVKSLAPRMEDPDRYSLSRDKGKTATQAALDRTRREFKREQKAVSRELRLDGAFIEHERRKEKDDKDSREKAKRNKNFAWMEGEQAAMNQQVRLGGGLLSGGGTGLARAKVKTAQMGIKKGGKF